MTDGMVFGPEPDYMRPAIAPVESSFSTILQIENNMDHFPYSHIMDATKREELEKAYKKEKDPRVATRMLAVHMVCVRKQSISEATANLIRSNRWVHTWLTRFDAGDLDGLRDLSRSSRSMQTRRWGASSSYTRTFHQATKSPNMTAWNAEPCLTEEV